MNNNTRRHPRTLSEAFGPYTSSELHPMREPEHLPWTAGDFALVAFVIAVIAAVFMHAPWI